jgi:uncharacterized delta-60 repeat protein
MHWFLAFVFVVIATTQLMTQDGTLDTSFDDDGIVITTIGTFDDQAAGIALQPNGRLVAVGHTYLEDRYMFVVARYLPNGALDRTFGNDGITITPVGNGNARARAVAIQPDGDIVVAGMCTVDGREMIAVARYLEKTGRLDPTFATNGIAITAVGNGWSAAHGVAILPSGKIGVVGYGQFTPDVRIAVVQYERSGTLDPTFGDSGIVSTQFALGSDIGNGIYAHEQDFITVVGTTHRTGSNADVALVRYKSSGALDGAFGTEGKVRAGIEGTFNEYGNAITVQQDGKIVVAASSRNLFQDYIVMRFLHNGERDREFGVNGVAKVDIGPDVALGESATILLQPDGKIVVAGLRTSERNTHIGLVRYRDNGQLDVTFGEDGYVTTSVGDNASVRGSVLQRDGKIVVAGGHHDGTQSRITLARYNNPSIAAPSSAAESLGSSGGAYPNPFYSWTRIPLRNSVHEPVIEVTDVVGRSHLVRFEQQGDTIVLYKGNLMPGPYVVRIHGTDGSVQAFIVVATK